MSERFGYSIAVATLIVAIVSPSFGVIADRRTIKMKWLKILTVIGAGSTLLAAPFLPINSQWAWLMIMFIDIGLMVCIL